jgi:hypothetical protein
MTEDEAIHLCEKVFGVDHSCVSGPVANGTPLPFAWCRATIAESRATEKAIKAGLRSPRSPRRIIHH